MSGSDSRVVARSAYRMRSCGLPATTPGRL